MQEKVLQIVIKAKNEAEKTLKGLNATLKENEKAFKGLALAGTVGLGAVVGVVATSVKAFGEAERSQRQLEHAIVAVSKGTKEQVARVNELTSALQKKAGIDADALNAGVAQLSTFGLQSESVVQLTKSLADLTVNQNGVTAGADQYISSANIMAKAMNGEFGALKKMGIRFTETQQNMIMFGDESQKVATLQEGLAQNLRETTDTVGGYDVMMGQLRQSLGEIQEAVGKGLQPVFENMSKILVPIVQSIGDWAVKNPNLISTIIIATGVMSAFLVVVGGIGAVLPSVILGLETIMGPVGLTIIAITALVGIFTALNLNFDWAKQKFTEFKDMLINNEAFVTVTSFIKELIDVGLQPLIWLFQTWVIPNFIELGRVIREELAPRFVEIWNALQPLMPLFEALAYTILGLIATGFLLIVMAVSSLIAILGIMLGGFTKVITILTGGVAWALGGTVTLVETLTNWFIKLYEWVGKAILKLSEFNIAQKAIDKVKSVAGKLTGKATGGGVQVGQSYMVGEKGPEMFTPSSNGSITPNYKLAGAGGVNVVNNITITGVIDDYMVEKLGDALVQNFKRVARI